jgi:DNA-binding IclR family transcriptional regulator
MGSDANDLLTRVCRVIADPNSRRVLEILALSQPTTIAELEERVRADQDLLIRFLNLMIELDLVERSGPYELYAISRGGFRLLRLWLDRVSSTSGKGHSNS